MKLEATYEKGVFVPAQAPSLAEHERVRLTIEPIANEASGSIETLRLRRRRRIRLEPDLAKEIATSAEFHPDEN